MGPAALRSRADKGWLGAVLHLCSQIHALQLKPGRGGGRGGGGALAEAPRPTAHSLPCPLDVRRRLSSQSLVCLGLSASPARPRV